MGVRAFAGFVLAGVLASAVALWILVPTPERDRLPRVTGDGLHRVPSSRFAVVYVKPGTDFARYEKFIILAPDVALAESERFGSRGSRPPAVERVKEAFAHDFWTAFTRELKENGGYPMADRPAKDVLILKPAVVGLRVEKPAAGSYSISAQGAILHLEVRDAVSGDVLARILDREQSGRAGTPLRSARKAGGSGAERRFGRLEEALRAGFDRAQREETQGPAR